jgi:hypothetical protein
MRQVTLAITLLTLLRLEQQVLVNTTASMSLATLMAIPFMEKPLIFGRIGGVEMALLA